MVAEYPTVSVICPYYNAIGTLPRLVDALLAQNYPQSKCEVILVNNGSTDGSEKLEIPVWFRRVQYSCIASSYAARNAGVRAARSPRLAFIDADCVPETTWLSAGVHALDDFDIVAGKVVITPFSRNSAWAQYDGLFNIDNEYACSRGYAHTANLFVHNHVFMRVGAFPEHVRSGGDQIWTARATRLGESLGYEDSAVVLHPARSGSELARKAFRVGSAGWHKVSTSSESSARRAVDFARFFVIANPVCVIERRRRIHGSNSLRLILFTGIDMVIRIIRLVGAICGLVGIEPRR